jgi:hypothetical protein
MSTILSDGTLMNSAHMWLTQQGFSASDYENVSVRGQHFYVYSLALKRSTKQGETPTNVFLFYQYTYKVSYCKQLNVQYHCVIL